MTSLDEFYDRLRELACLWAGIEVPFVEHFEAGPNVQESSSENEEVEKLMRAAKYVKGALEISLWESKSVEYSSNAVEYSTT